MKKILIAISLLLLSDVTLAQFSRSLIQGDRGASFASEYQPCPYNLICTGDIVSIGMDVDDFAKWSDSAYEGAKVEIPKDPSSFIRNPSIYKKGFDEIASGDEVFHGFYYRVKPNKTYVFRVVSTYISKRREKRSWDSYLIYRSRGDAHAPSHVASEGAIDPNQARLSGLPAIPACHSELSPNGFCTNQVVHIFWNNYRGHGKAVDNVDVYANGRHIASGKGRHDAYYTLPADRYDGEPIHFSVTYLVRVINIGSTHYEHSQTFIAKYRPQQASLCQVKDSWETCQHH